MFPSSVARSSSFRLTVHIHPASNPRIKKIAVVPKPGADFEIQERDIPTPGQGQVRIKVQACGVCFSDHIAKDGLMPWIQYPRSPGHEIAGVIDEVGPQVTSWKEGQRVGVGWHGGHDFTCLDKVNEAYNRMTSGKAQFRVVLTM
jgi:D-arabinose 1-dehydrogenase-like Zn-dependent alcohol dehydrogenase